MNQLQGVVHRFPLTVFSVLACAFGWMFAVTELLRGQAVTSQFPLGPLLAAAVVSTALGRDGLRTWWRRLATVRAHPGWYFLALLAPVGLMAVVVLVNSRFGAPAPTGAQLAGWTGLGGELLGMFIAVGIGEEAGWTAFATPRLLARHRFGKTFLLIVALRVLWHLPLVARGKLPLVTGVVANAGFQLVILWVYVRSGGVWLLAAIWHAVHNVSSGFLSPMVDGADRIRIGPILAVVYWLVAGLVLVLDRRHLASTPGPGVATGDLPLPASPIG